MKSLKNILTLVCLALVLKACLGDKKTSSEVSASEVKTESTSNSLKAESEAKRLCETFPEALIMKHNPDAIKIEKETQPISNNCKIKLFYGKRDYDFWEGLVSAWESKSKDPFWQYNPERNAALYHKVEDVGEKAVFITNMNQLLILKNGIVYSITPPNNGRATNSGKLNKEIALEMAKHYNL